jgi:SAM-dependent methyltransferase
LAAARAGAPTLAIDRNPEFLRELEGAARAAELPLRVLRADLESGHGIPVQPRSCGAVLVVRFLSRPLVAEIEQALAPGGLLLYETFTIQQKELGYGPSNPAFLLRPGELPSLFAGLERLSAWEGMTSGHKPWALARLAAKRPLG